MRHDKQNDISPNHGRIRPLGATWSWCVVFSIVIGPVCFLEASRADPLSTSTDGGSCNSLPAINENQFGTQGSASNCQKQDGDLVAHEYNGTRQQFYRIEAPFGAPPTDVKAAFVSVGECKNEKSSRCIKYAAAYEDLLKLAFSTAPAKDTLADKIVFHAQYYYAQTGQNKIELIEAGKTYSVQVPRFPMDWKKDFTDEQKKRLAVRTTLTDAADRDHSKDHENDQWRLVQVSLDPDAVSLTEGKASPSKWENICGGDRLAMIMFGKVDTQYPNSWSPLSLDLVLRLKAGTPENIYQIDTEKLEMVIVCETSMTAKCAYEHGYRPWAELKDRSNRPVPTEDVAALLSTCALASTQCTREGNHIVVIDDLGMNRPYPLDYGKKYFDYEATFRYEATKGPHREHVCRLREVDTSARCKAQYENMDLGECISDGSKYNEVHMMGFTDLFSLNLFFINSKPEDWLKKIIPKENELLITEDGRWYAGKNTGLASYNGDVPPFSKDGRRIIILSQATPHPTHPARVLSDASAEGRLKLITESMELDSGHFYIVKPPGAGAGSREVENYLRNLEGKPFDYVTCSSSNDGIVCFLYKSKKGKVKFPSTKEKPRRIFQLSGPA